MKAHEKIKLICPFCGAKVRTYTNLFAGSLIMFKCTDKKCGALVSFDISAIELRYKDCTVKV